jgi:hypothetical protein
MKRDYSGRKRSRFVVAFRLFLPFAAMIVLILLAAGLVVLSFLLN